MHKYPQGKLYCGMRVVQQILIDQGFVPPPSVFQLQWADTRWRHRLICMTTASVPSSMQCMLGHCAQLETFDAPLHSFPRALAILQSHLASHPVILGVLNRVGGKIPHWVMAYEWDKSNQELLLYDPSSKVAPELSLPRGNARWSRDQLEKRWKFPKWTKIVLHKLAPGEIPGLRFGIAVQQ